MAIDYKDIPFPTKGDPQSLLPNLKTGWENWKLARLASQNAYYTSVIPAKSSFSALIATIGSATATIYVNSTVTLSTPLTTPSNISIVRLEGGGFTSGNASTLTINGPFSSPISRAFFGDLVVVFGSGSVEYGYSQWWGAVATSFNDAVDCSAAIQAAVTALRVVFFPVGTYGMATGVTIPPRSRTLKGCGPEVTYLKYIGTSFVDLFTVQDTSETTYIRLRDLGFAGGDSYVGTTRWLFKATGFNNSEIYGCGFENSVGFIQITSGYLSTIRECRFNRSTARPSEAGITHAQWEEVWGTNKAPIMVGEWNNADFSNNTLYHVGTEQSDSGGGVMVDGESLIVLEGGNKKISNVSIEGTVDYTGNFAYTMAVKNAVNFRGPGNFDGFYMEDNHFTQAVVYMPQGDGQVEFTNALWYNITVDLYLFYSLSSGQFWVRNGFAYRLYCPQLYKWGNAVTNNSVGSFINFDNFKVAAGSVYSVPIASGGPNDGAENVFDTLGTSYPSGLNEDVDTDVYSDRLIVPRKRQGYVVTSGAYLGSDFVQITSGTIWREDGKVSNSKMAAGNVLGNANNCAFRLRPPTASRYYRVYIGKAGQPYLLSYASAQTDPTGNWIAEFQTDASNVISGLVNNARMDYQGVYPGGNSSVIVKHGAIPTSGYWRAGDMILNTSPSATSPTGWTCTTAGVAGGGTIAWRAIDDRSETIVVEKNSDGNFCGLRIRNTNNAGTNDSASVDFEFRGPDTVNNRNAGRIKAVKVLDYNGTANQDSKLVFTVAINETNTDTLQLDESGLEFLLSGRRFKFQEGPIVRAGSGTPEAVVTAPIGSLYLRTDGGAGTSMYVKESGAGNTGWVGK